MWEGFCEQPDYDPHQSFADATGLPRKREHSGQKTAKEGNFSILYGAGIKKLMQDFQWEEGRAREIKRIWRQTYPEVDHLNNFIQMSLERRGWIANEYGRRYYIDLDKAYLGLNYIVQGTSADLIKRGLNAAYEVQRELREACEGPEPLYLDNVVHDEVLFEVREDLLCPGLVHRLIGALTTHKRDGEDIFTVPITAGAEIGDPDWGHLKEYNLLA
jgi:DNA polymerase I-like protein with 3'-5' exonuclease and polymerase domains